jgi:hypothetical protein
MAVRRTFQAVEQQDERGVGRGAVDEVDVDEILAAGRIPAG